MTIKSVSNGVFKYKNGEYENWVGDCFCGSKKEQFSSNYGDEYCCVQQNSPMSNNCQIDFSNGKWCQNASLVSISHICSNNCFYSDQEVCPSNPEACMWFGNGCDGRDRCEAFCTGPLENFPYYNQTAKRCFYDYSYCGKREEAKYHNHQCFNDYSDDDISSMIRYQCLNRYDVSEDTIRRSVNYNSFVSARQNLFPYFKANDTMNKVTETQIICGNQKIDKNCTTNMNNYWNSKIECKKEETDNIGILISNKDVCDALDFLEEKGLTAPTWDYAKHIYSRPYLGT